MARRRRSLAEEAARVLRKLDAEASPGTGSTRTGTQQPREHVWSGTGTSGGRSRAPGGRRRRRRGGARGGDTTDHEEARGGVRRGRPTTRKMKPSSLEAEQH